MGVIKVHGADTVVDAAKNRIEALSKANPRVYVSFSGGKESLCLAHLVIDLVAEGRIDPGKFIFLFIDEEAIYPCVERVVRNYRNRLRMDGCQFYWLCLPIKHFNCFNELTSDETFVCWDPKARDRWVRDMPKFSIKDHPLFRVGEPYQPFLQRLNDGPHIIGLRAQESVQRMSAIANRKRNNTDLKRYPLLDWNLNDVWLYLKKSRAEVPDAYLYMWKVGITGRGLRISQFFCIDTASSLVRMMEFYPGLYEKIIAREPNAYLATMYWDTEMFGRRTRKGKELGQDVEYKGIVMAKLPNLKSKDKKMYEKIRGFLVKYSATVTDETWKALYRIVIAGDPKYRTFRKLYTTLEK